MITLKFKNFVIIVAKMTDRKRTTRRDDEREEYMQIFGFDQFRPNDERK